MSVVETKKERDKKQDVGQSENSITTTTTTTPLSPNATASEDDDEELMLGDLNYGGPVRR